jgi:hypothetical protein
MVPCPLQGLPRFLSNNQAQIRLKLMQLPVYIILSKLEATHLLQLKTHLNYHALA